MEAKELAGCAEHKVLSEREWWQTRAVRHARHTLIEVGAIKVEQPTDITKGKAIGVVAVETEQPADIAEHKTIGAGAVAHAVPQSSMPA